MRREFLVCVALALLALSLMVLWTGERGPSPLKEFAASAIEIKSDLKHGDGLKERYLVFAEGQYLLTPAQLLYYSAKALEAAAQGRAFTLNELENFLPPSQERGEFASFWKELKKEEYLELAVRVATEMELSKRAPGTIETPVGEIRFRDALFTLLRVLSDLASQGELPTKLPLAPDPSGSLLWDNHEVPARLAYYLLPTNLVTVGSPGVLEVLKEVKQNQDPKELAEDLCRWVHLHIQLEANGEPKNSEEVLRLSRGGSADLSTLYLALVRSAGLPARGVKGMVVLEQKLLGFELVGRAPGGELVANHAWAEVYLPGEGWTIADPSTNSFGFLPFKVYSVPREEEWREVLVAYELIYGGI